MHERIWTVTIPPICIGESGQSDQMKAWSDGVAESWSVGSLRIRASLQYSSTPIFRFTSCFILCAVLFALCFAAQAQQAETPKIGRLLPNSPASGAERSGLLGQEFRALGYIEGKNIAIEYRYADNKPDRLQALAEELVGLKVDIVVASSTPAVLALKNATSTIPIVFLRVSDPVAVGLINNLARPGGNITGVTNIAPVLASKRLELLKETVAKLSHCAVLWNPKDPGSAPQWKESQLAARELGLQVHSMEVSSADQYERAFQKAIQARSGALAVTDHALAVSNQKQIADLATKNRLPAIYGQGIHVESGGLMSYGADEAEISRRVASMVDKILKGTKPSDIPVEQPTKFELVINLKRAKQIGLAIPQKVLARADKVIR